MRKRLMIIFAVMTVFMAVAAVAVAQETNAVGSGSAQGRGWVWAKGTGTAILDGRGKVGMAIDGDVVIYDFAGDAVVKVRAVPDGSDGAGARAQELSPTSTYTLDNFRGRLSVRGSDFRIEAEGMMKFRARGQGVVQVEGDGWWRTRNARGVWDGTRIAFGGAVAAAE